MKAKREENQKVYRKFATVYDRLNADLFSVEMVGKTFDLLDQFDFAVERSLDLCCGTGTAVKIFAGASYDADGLDGSRDMLKIARAKLKRFQSKLYCQTLPNFKIPEKRGSSRLKKYDLITSFFDSLNYMLTAKALKRTFRSVGRHLNRGGAFVFDMNTPHALRYMWDDNVITELKDDLGTIWHSSYDPTTRQAVCDATFFVKEGRHWIRFDEAHVEAGYSNAEIKRLLKETGFKVRGFYDCKTMDRPNRETNRICVIAERL